VGALLLLTPALALGQAPATTSDTSCDRPAQLLYLGDRDFGPFEYLDQQGRPAGFNIEVVRAIERELGLQIEVQLLPWTDVRRALDERRAHLFSLAYSPQRAADHDFLGNTSTLHSSLMLRPGRASYPRSYRDLAGLSVAVEDGALSQRVMTDLPESIRPRIVATPNHRASMALLVSGEVDAVAGAGATLRWMAQSAHLEGAVEVPIASRPYALVTRKGCAATMADIAAVIPKLAHQGMLDEIAKRTLVAPPRNLLTLEQLQILLAAVIGLTVLGLAWIWMLRRTVHARTMALSSAFIEQKRLTDIMRSNEDRLAFAMDIIGAGVWEWDLATDRIQASTRWAGSFGYRPEEAPTSYDTWMAFVHPDDRERVTGAARAHIEGRAPRFEATYRVPRKGGDWLWILDRGRVVRWDAEGTPLRMVGALNDITVQLEAERALHEAKEAAEATSRAKSTFLATVSHEIRTPLNAVIGSAGLLETTELDQNQRELVELVRRGADSLLALVNDVLDFTKIESGRLELDQHPFELTALVAQAITLVEHSATAKGLRIQSAIDAVAPMWLLGDVTRLRQILLNLLSNAVKFTADGVVRLDVAATDDETATSVCFTVRDTGIGIPQDRMDRLFQPFTQVDSSTTRRFGGTGLGLAISRRLADLMGASLTVDSSDGQGSTFTFTVSLARTERPTAAAMIAPSLHNHPPRLRVVLAEDNPVNQIVQRRMLRQLGYPCDVTANGIELLEAVGKADYDVAILDIQMPEMDGLEAARELRARGHHDLFMIALTADVTTETRESCVAAGFDAYLSKPVTAEMLAAALAKAAA
jgi:PAS domain S-box-containing protein